MENNIKRCKWCNLKNELYIKYHDEEWGKATYDDHKLFELLILESFQAGLSWECVLNKRESFRQAFDNFEIDRIIRYDDKKINELLNNSNIIRNKLKINSAINNSKIFKQIQNEYGTFAKYIWYFTNNKIIYETGKTSSDLSDKISKDLKNRGMKFVGTTIIYSYLQAIGVINSHGKECYLGQKGRFLMEEKKRAKKNRPKWGKKADQKEPSQMEEKNGPKRTVPNGPKMCEGGIKMYKKLTVKDIIDITKAEMLQGDVNQECQDFAYDTRKMKPNDVYVGIKTEKADGSNYWQVAFENGANVVIINKIDIIQNDLDKWKNKTVLVVEDSLLALQEIAKYKREQFGNNLKVIAITGSVGKTSTKDMVANVVSQKYKTLKTAGNYNNHIGVPLTLLRLKDEEVVVLEMGMNHFGEIDTLTKIAKPDLAVITNIGTSHIGNLGSRENILKAKLEILEGMEKKEVIINNDNDLLGAWYKNNKQNDIKIHAFGIENTDKNKVEVWADNIKLQENLSEFTCHFKDKEIKLIVPVAGMHFIYNALCAVIVGNLLDINIQDIKNGIETFELTKKRMEITKLENGVVVINDAYNASPEAVKASIKNLEGYKTSKKIAVLGDMLELGNFSEKLHREIGEFIANSEIDELLCCGENSKYIVEEAKKNGMKNVYYFKDGAQIVQYLKQNVTKNEVVLFKASNGMKFFEICEEFIKKFVKL